MSAADCEIPHRVIQMCTGDLSFTASQKYDIEVWAPGCGEWLEVSSCSNFGDFQAATRQYSLSPRQRPETPICPHVEWLRVGAAARDDCCDRELPASGWFHCGAGRIARLYGRGGRHSMTMYPTLPADEENSAPPRALPPGKLEAAGYGLRGWHDQYGDR